MKIRFAIAATAMILILLTGLFCVVKFALSGNYVGAFLAIPMAMALSFCSYRILRPDPLAQSRAAVTTAAAAALAHPKVRQDPALRRTILEADHEQGTGRLGR